MSLCNENADRSVQLGCTGMHIPSSLSSWLPPVLTEYLKGMFVCVYMYIYMYTHLFAHIHLYLRRWQNSYFLCIFFLTFKKHYTK